MNAKSVIASLILVVAAVTAAASAQVIANVDRLYPNWASSAVVVRLAPQPLADGVRAYADRTHLYVNVPSVLAGAEYVLMSNEDKYNPAHELHVTIASEGTLYLIIDNRVGTHVRDKAISPNLWTAGMAWVTEMGFVDTGMKMAVDESADGTIDNYYTAFSMPVSPGVIVLKAQNDVYFGGPHDRNMYGVAAVAFDEATSPVPPDGVPPEVLPEHQGLQAWDPQPGSGTNAIVGPALDLSWSPGDTAAAHDLYLGTDVNAVEMADPLSPLYQGRQIATTFPLDGLVESGGRYFWRVDEVEADGATIYRGDVWTFTVCDDFVIDDFESYTDQEGSRLQETWIDGSLNGSGSQVARWITPLVQRGDFHHGKWSMSLTYDNAAVPLVSEVERAFAVEQDWTAGDANALSLWCRGDVVSFNQTSPGGFAMSATGADIWGDGDEFRYAYQRLDGDGSIVARIDRVDNTDIWAKAGVMIRESLDPASAYAFMLVTPDGIRAFQNRPANYSTMCLSAHTWEAMAIPSWVKLERKGGQFTGYHSLDGINWIQQPDTDNAGPDPSPNPQFVPMPPYVYVGLALTSHAPGVTTTATFSGVEIAGDVIGPWEVAEIGVAQPGNGPGELYVVVEDGAGATVMVIHSDPTVVSTAAWTEWKIPLSSFAGVNLSQVRKLCIGVGVPDTACPHVAGRIYIDDIRLVNR